MGRQTSVSLSDRDERTFLDFLNRTAKVQLLRFRADDRDKFFVSEFPPRESGETSFYLWNTAFPFEPEFAPSSTLRDGEPASSLRIRNTPGAPLIEYTRDAYHNPTRKVYGRVYWNSDFAVYRGIEYNRLAFGRWFDHVVRWLRKNGYRIEIAKGWSLYCLPGTWEASAYTNQSISR